MSKKTKTFRLPKIHLILIIAALLTILACEGEIVNPGKTHAYRLQGVVVVDQNASQRTVAVNLWRNDSLYGEALVLAGGNVVPYVQPAPIAGNAYYLVDTNAASLLGDSLELTMIDSSNSFAVDAIVPDSFSILSVAPFNRIVNGLSDNVTLEWSGSSGTEGYILAAVKADSVYKGLGYSAAVATQITGGTIPPVAFQLYGTVESDTGLYNIYVYAITGSPDSVLASAILPTQIPEQLAANISEVRFSGWFGSIQVVYRDTVRVATIP